MRWCWRCGLPGLADKLEAGRSYVTEFCWCGGGLVLPGFRESKDMDVMGLEHIMNCDGSVFVEQRADV